MFDDATYRDAASQKAGSDDSKPVMLREYSDRVLELLLKAHKPAFRERSDIPADIASSRTAQPDRRRRRAMRAYGGRTFRPFASQERLSTKFCDATMPFYPTHPNRSGQSRFATLLSIKRSMGGRVRDRATSGGKGHEYLLPPPRPSAGCGFSKGPSPGWAARRKMRRFRPFGCP